MTPDDKCYGLDSQERLDMEAEEVIKRLIDDACLKAGEPFDAIAARLTWPIKVIVFRRMSVLGLSSIIADRALENALELLDEKHADPDGDATEPTSRMIEAAAAFGKAVTEDYVSWACESTGVVIEFTLEQAREMFAEKPEGA